MLKEKETVSDEFCWHLSNIETQRLRVLVFVFPRIWKWLEDGKSAMDSLKGTFGHSYLLYFLAFVEDDFFLRFKKVSHHQITIWEIFFDFIQASNKQI